MTLETVIAKDKGRDVQITYKVTPYGNMQLWEKVVGSEVYQCICKEEENELFNKLCKRHFFDYGCPYCSGYEKNKGCYNMGD